MSADSFTLLICALVVGYFAYKRFNLPVEGTANLLARHSTTFERFVLSAGLYIVAIEMVFITLTAFFSLSSEYTDPVFKLLNIEFSGEEGGLAPPLLSAMLLTSLLPSSQRLQALDEKLRALAHGIGSIPRMVRRLGKGLRHTRYSTPQEARAGVRTEVMRRAPESAVRFDHEESLEHLWTKVVSIVLMIKDWRHHHPEVRQSSEEEDRNSGLWDDYRTVHKQAQRDYAAILRKYDDLRLKVSQCLTNTENPDPQNELTNGYRQSVRELLQAFMVPLSLYVARGLLMRTKSQEDRKKALQRMGFEPFDDDTQAVLSVTHLAVVAVGIFVVMVVSFLAVGTVTGLDFQRGFAHIAMTASMVATIYVVAVGLAVYSKGMWRRSGVKPASFEALPGYFLTSLAAVVANVVVSVVFRSLYLADGALAFDKAAQALAWTHPWLLSTFVVTFAISLATDIYYQRTPPKYFWILESLSISALLTFVNAVAIHHWLVMRWNAGTPPADLFLGPNPPNQAMVAVASLVIGALFIGWVPSAYRKRVLLAPHQALEQHLDANLPSIGNQAREAKNGNGRDADKDLVGDSLAFCCACVAAADGHVEPIEESRFGMLLGSICNRGAVALDRDAVMDAFRGYCGRLVSHDLSSRAFEEFFVDQFDGLRVLIGRRDLALTVLRCCEAVASADDIVRPVEYEVIRRIAARIQLPPQDIVIRSTSDGAMVRAA